ncbi:acyltransferase family protein [Mumia quercus]|uniref:acyltransferase family protein n=1 Tax=Mumia quercus TaxID=2976125 RepID=UPI0021D03AAA|nr:acyltransferase family protein [Mumia quercus]
MSGFAATAPGRRRQGEAPGAAAMPRLDIQGLRAIAVGLVLVYHLWPGTVRGGFVGVDVFFVISGFLITSHLLRRPPSSARDLATFWSRRIRRLLPASLLVLLVTLVASRLLAPETAWEATARQVRASALYVVNWVLASDSVDYLASAADPTPVQHFWSLSVEEQFYAFWPVLLLALAWVARRRRSSMIAVAAIGLSAVVVASFTWSVVATAQEPARAYFVTTTRVWELGIGALAAVLVASRAASRSPHPAHPVRAVVAWGGLAAVAWAGLTYSAATPFPGWQAALPVLGAAMVIVADAPRTGGSPVRLLATRPVQWLGDVSYSVYLWHWPLIVLAPAALGRGLGPTDKLAILATTLVLAAATKRWVEDRFRRPGAGSSLVRVYAVAAVAMAVVVALSTLQLREVEDRRAESRAALESALAGDRPCFGAAAFADDSCDVVTRSDELLPAPADALHDVSEIYTVVSGRPDCRASGPEYVVVECGFGVDDASFSVALLGNSHAAQWLPALEEVADKRRWSITTFVASTCAATSTYQDVASDEVNKACQAWGDEVVDRIVEGGFDLVVTSNYISGPAGGRTMATSGPAYERGYADVIRRLVDGGTKVVGIADNPGLGHNVPRCLAENPDDYRPCGRARSKVEPDDPFVAAVARVSDRRAQSIDMNDWICRPKRCPAAVGGVTVYSDHHHLTATYVETLWPVLDQALATALARAGR